MTIAKKLNELIADMDDSEQLYVEIVGGTHIDLTEDDGPEVHEDMLRWNWGALRIDAIRFVSKGSRDER